MGAPDGIDIDVDREAVASFLDSDGGVEVIVAVSEGGLRYSKLDEKMRVVGSTFNRRRGEAVDLGIIEGESRETESGMENFYVLTPLGQAIRKRIDKERLGELYWRLLELEDEFDDSSEEVIEWVADEDSALEDVVRQVMMSGDFDKARDDYQDYF